eukprot:5218437-Pyramimonas_sp.AAC.1
MVLARSPHACLLFRASGRPDRPEEPPRSTPDGGADGPAGLPNGPAGLRDGRRGRQDGPKTGQGGA